MMCLTRKNADFRLNNHRGEGQDTLVPMRCIHPMRFKNIPRPSSAASKGFTLMEVLVALAILGITFTVLFGLLSGSLRNIDRVGEREKILRLARMKLNELILQANRGIVLPQSSGQWDGRYRWKSSIVAVSPEDGQESPSQQSPPYLLARIKLSVTWTSRGGEIEFPLETATWMPVVEKDEK